MVVDVVVDDAPGNVVEVVDMLAAPQAESEQGNLPKPQQSPEPTSSKLQLVVHDRSLQQQARVGIVEVVVVDVVAPVHAESGQSSLPKPIQPRRGSTSSKLHP